MKKVLLLLMTAVLLLSCEKKEEVTNRDGYYPECTLVENVYFDIVDTPPEEVKLEFVGAIYNKGDKQGYKWRIINPSNRMIRNLKIESVEDSNIYGGINSTINLPYFVPKNKNLFIFTPHRFDEFYLKYTQTILPTIEKVYQTNSITFNNYNRIRACFFSPNN